LIKDNPIQLRYPQAKHGVNRAQRWRIGPEETESIISDAGKLVLLQRRSAMKPLLTRWWHLALLVAVLVFPFPSVVALAHCDSMDGPVVAAASRALDSGDLRPTLVWVPKRDEAEVAAAFDRAKARPRSKVACRHVLL
jgi:hypothetical protein